jgi:hypothetical protein
MKTVVPVLIIHDCDTVRIVRKPNWNVVRIEFPDQTVISVFGKDAMPELEITEEGDDA